MVGGAGHWFSENCWSVTAFLSYQAHFPCLCRPHFSEKQEISGCMHILLHSHNQSKPLKQIYLEYDCPLQRTTAKCYYPRVAALALSVYTVIHNRELESFTVALFYREKLPLFCVLRLHVSYPSTSKRSERMEKSSKKPTDMQLSSHSSSYFASSSGLGVENYNWAFSLECSPTSSCSNPFCIMEGLTFTSFSYPFQLSTEGYILTRQIRFFCHEPAPGEETEF